MSGGRLAVNAALPQRLFGFGALLLAARGFAGVACPRYTEQHAHFTQQNQQTRAAVREKRQTDAGVGQKRRVDADMPEHLPRDLRDDADAQQRAEIIRRAQRNKNALQN